MIDRVPSRDECVHALESAGFVIRTTVCPQLETFMKHDQYINASRIADPIWHRGDSFWSLVSNEEKARVADIVGGMRYGGARRD